MWRRRLKALVEWRWFAALNSVVVLVLVVFVLSRRVGFEDLDGILARLKPAWLLAAVPMGFLVALAAALRARDVYSREAHAHLPLLPTYRLTLVAQFMAYAVPIAVAVDVIRVGLFRLRFGMSFEASARATVFDRLVGALGLIVVGSATFFLQPVLTESPALVTFQAVVFLGACALVVVVLLLAWLAPDLRWTPARVVLNSVRRLDAHFKGFEFVAKQAFFALLYVGFACAAFWMVSRALALDIPFLAMLAFAPLILFVNSLPFLYAGWGGRELITVVTLNGAMGVPADQALLVSIGYGLLMLVVALPGAAFWLTRPTFRKVTPSDHVQPPEERKPHGILAA